MVGLAVAHEGKKRVKDKSKVCGLIDRRDVDGKMWTKRVSVGVGACPVGGVEQRCEDVAV